MFIGELGATDWSTEVSISYDGPNLSFNLFEAKINYLLEKYIPLKMLNNRELKLERKQWITKVIRKTISKQDKLHRKFLKERIQES